MENFLSRGKNQIQNRIGRLSTRVWLKEVSREHGQLSDDTEVREVIFEDGLLTVRLGKIVPEHHTRKTYL
jgi:hypothetical protein